MRKLQFVLFIVIIAVITGISGCVYVNTPVVSPTPQPTPVVVQVHNPISPTPVPATPTPRVTPTDSVVVINSQPSELVKLKFSPVESDIMTDVIEKDGQVDNFTMVVANDDTNPVKNVKIEVSIRDSNKGVDVYDQEYSIGDLDGGEYKQVWLETKPHDDVNLMTVTFKLIWGQNEEYYNPNDYKYNLEPLT